MAMSAGSAAAGHAQYSPSCNVAGANAEREHEQRIEQRREPRAENREPVVVSPGSRFSALGFFLQVGTPPARLPSAPGRWRPPRRSMCCPARAVVERRSTSQLGCCRAADEYSGSAGPCRANEVIERRARASSGAPSSSSRIASLRRPTVRDASRVAVERCLCAGVDRADGRARLQPGVGQATISVTAIWTQRQRHRDPVAGGCGWLGGKSQPRRSQSRAPPRMRITFRSWRT